MSKTDLGTLKPWLGRTDTKDDILTPGLIERFRATLGTHLSDRADAAPLGIHWCLALEAVPSDALAVDGHTKKGAFLPPVPLPSRMWAGGDVTHVAPLTVGETVTRHSVVEDIAAKQGRSGELVFVTVRHEYSCRGRVCISERQDIVYKDVTPPRTAPAHAAPDETEPNTLKSVVTPDPTLLFRYSALTFNAHRIHYDHVYTTRTEAYPGLVVHGPLQATLLLNIAAEALGHTPGRFSFRGAAPVTLPCRLHLHCRDDGSEGAVWCQDQTGLRSFIANYAGK
ncbi:MaoC family dehydratase N-terminal domain-containing protein [Labrenzia sp. R4_2]|uniref:FAS1-like dehydratase domain-containing protein n=1 Tax=Stappiaceae TaxID=2821832 RepID=UPI001ADBAD91|nr:MULTISPECIES: MaoC family dehydratase N-terminal domain-containing protein [Stappiaceae]MBO9422549.1 MaoC family dehydratase N-terminal domain-containing protein [Labrenzia sp. R4_2]